MGFLKREEKPPEKVKVAKASLPFHATDTNATCFKCGKVGHLRKDCKDGKTTTSQSKGFYSGYGVKGHNEAKYWKLHPKLKPTGSKRTKAGGNEKDKETKASTGEKKGWKAKFAELEAKMAAMSATTTYGGAKPHVTPSFYIGKGFGPDNKEYGDFMMSGMAVMVEDLTLEVFANTRSQTAAPKDTPQGTSSNLDPQHGEGNRQARLPESFTLEDMVPTTSKVYPSRVEASSNRPSQRGAKPPKASGMVQEAASLIYQASLFSAAMVSHSDFSPAAVFKRAATMCKSGHSTVATTLKTAVDAEQVVESQEDTVQGLFSAAARVKTMPARPAIERSSITLGVVVVDNSQGIFQLVGPKGKVFVPQRVLLDSGAQPLMLGASAIEGLGLTKDTLEKCPWTISTSIGGTEHSTTITKGELALKLNQDDVEDASFMKVKAIVTEAKSYDVLVGSTVLYPMGFTLDFWEETASYRPRWQASDGCKASLPARFIRVLTGNLADLFAFSGLVDAASPWFMETFDENAFITHLHMQVDAQVSAQNLESIKVHQPGIEAAWSTTAQLHEAAELVVQEAWQESLLPQEEEGSDGTKDHGPLLDNSTIHRKPPDDGIVLLELFGGIGTSLAALLQAGIKVQ
jgi:hypothetical protein